MMGSHVHPKVTKNIGTLKISNKSIEAFDMFNKVTDMN